MLYEHLFCGFAIVIIIIIGFVMLVSPLFSCVALYMMICDLYSSSGGIYVYIYSAATLFCCDRIAIGPFCVFARRQLCASGVEYRYSPRNIGGTGESSKKRRNFVVRLLVYVCVFSFGGFVCYHIRV